MVKLRTMPAGTPEVRAQDLPVDAVTPYQQIIRSTRLNELPQLLNVLAGHMSVVGPRAQIKVHREQTLNHLSPIEQKDWLKARRKCRPGLFDPYVLQNGLLKDGDEDDPVARAHSDMDYYYRNASLSYDIRVVAGWLTGAVNSRRQVQASLDASE